MLPTPTKFALVSGVSEGSSKLNAFDHALLNAGVGNCNLLKVSSILPPGAKQVADLHIPAGSLVPIAYGSLCLDSPGELIAAAVGVGIGNPESYGVIMEYSGRVSKDEAEIKIKRMVEEAFSKRGLALSQILVQAVEHRVEDTGCVFAAVVLWY
jgi:arginine decarboxylase